MLRPMAVTSKDIARKLKISQSTVSRALRGDPRVAPETMARVLEAARQMNYTPNLAARSLITRKTGTVGVVVHDITNPFYPELLDILHNEFALAGYRTVLFNERTDASSSSTSQTSSTARRSTELIYVSATLGIAAAGTAARRPGRPREPLHRLDATSTRSFLTTAAADGSWPRRWSSWATGRSRSSPGLRTRRRAGTASAASASSSQASGVEFDEALRRVGQFSHQSGYQWCLELLAAEPRPTAVFAANDVIAFGALDAARRVGVRVPDELSIVGFDDIDMAGWEGFNLTTVRQPLAEMGRAAANLLIERIESGDGGPPRRRVFPVRLVRRDTLAPRRRARERTARRPCGLTCLRAPCMHYVCIVGAA